MAKRKAKQLIHRPGDLTIDLRLDPNATDLGLKMFYVWVDSLPDDAFKHGDIVQIPRAVTKK